jgi:hypothetical protein
MYAMTGTGQATTRQRTGCSRVEAAVDLREGVLQDLVAVGFMVNALRSSLDEQGSMDPGTARMFQRVSATLSSDVERLRSAIFELAPLAA